jgi:hypothetical protein
MVKPAKWYCTTCMKESTPKKEPTVTTISLYRGSKLRKRRVWVCNCKTCDKALMLHDVPQTLLGKDSMCANCGVAIFPAGKTVHECLNELAAKDLATFPVRDKILKQKGRIADEGIAPITPITPVKPVDNPEPMEGV